MCVTEAATAPKREGKSIFMLGDCRETNNLDRWKDERFSAPNKIPK